MRSVVKLAMAAMTALGLTAAPAAVQARTQASTPVLAIRASGLPLAAGPAAWVLVNTLVMVFLFRDAI